MLQEAIRVSVAQQTCLFLLLDQNDDRGAGIIKALRARNCREGDTVVVGPITLTWSDDRSEATMYGAWLEAQKEQGKGHVGSAKWPH